MKYSELLLQHFHHPKNVGKLSVGENIYHAESDVSGGDKIHLYINVNVDGKIADVRYQVKGCPATIACMSWMSNELIGRNILDVKEVTAAKMIQALDLPSHKQRSALLAEEILHKILSQMIDE
jgi:nitrogen fixation protein NifU and related proteins